MKVITIHEDNHGFIGVAANKRSAQIYVIENWLAGYFYIYQDDKEETIEEAFGEDWKEALKEVSFTEFKTLMSDSFWFYEETLIE